MITHVDFKRTDIRHSIVSMPSPVPNTYFVMAENGLAGAALERFLTNIVYGSDHFSEAAVHDRFEALQRVAGGIPAGSDGLLFLPWLSGAIAPSEDGLMRGGFLNISTRTPRGDMARAVLEGVSQNLRWLRGPVEKFAKRRFTHFSVYGGAARSDLWCQITADVLGSPVHQLDNCDYTVSVGAGLLAFERLGDLAFDDIGSLVRTRRVFDPDPRNTATYDVLHEQFVRAFKATRPIHRALNAHKGTGG
jgi:xylulokinase